MVEGSTAPAASPYAAATENLRGAAKWLLTAAAGVGGLLVAGLQVGSLGHLTSGDVLRLVVALMGLAVALSGVGVVIFRAGSLLSDEWLTLGQLSSEDFQARLQSRDGAAKAVYNEVETYREELYGDVATTVGGLYKELKNANAEARATKLSGTEDDAASARSIQLQTAVKRVVDFANYRRTRAKFESLRTALGLGGIAVVIGVVVFAVAGNPPSAPSESKPDAPSTSKTAAPSATSSVSTRPTSLAPHTDAPTTGHTPTEGGSGG